MIHNSTFHRLLYLASTCLTFNSLKIYLAFTFSLLCELRHSKNVLYTRFSAFWLSPPSCRHASGSLLLGDFPVTCVYTCCELPRALCYLISALTGGLGYCVGLGTSVCECFSGGSVVELSVVHTIFLALGVYMGIELEPYLYLFVCPPPDFGSCAYVYLGGSWVLICTFRMLKKGVKSG